MPMPRDIFQSSLQEQMIETWRMYVKNMESSLNSLEAGLNEASEMRDVCTSEWCQATKYLIEDIGNSFFSISEPRGLSEQDSKLWISPSFNGGSRGSMARPPLAIPLF